MSLFSDFLANTFDSIFAPASAFDTHSDAHTPDIGGSLHTSMMDTTGGADWHNNWGTAADFQVPAETGNLFSSSDWSSSGSDWTGTGGSGISEW